MSLIEKIKKNSTLKRTEVLSSSKFFGDKELIATPVPMFNVALSGKIDGGLGHGLTTIAGKSKHFKTGYLLLLMASFLKKYEDGVVLFYDSEFGTPQSYFENYGIDMNRVVHIPIMNVEELKFDIISQLEGLEDTDNVFIGVDSIGNLASKKEIEDALNEKAVADMTRAKQLKSLFRMVTPYLTAKKLPMVVINHVYDTMELYSTQVMGGGTGAIYSSDTILFVGKSQEKDSEGIQGYSFTLTVEKSRFVKEKSKIPITVLYNSGIDKFSGLLELALEGGFVEKSGNGYVRTHITDDAKFYFKKNTTKDIGIWWKEVFTNTGFKKFIESKYALEGKAVISSESDDVEEVAEEVVETVDGD
jgi:RecA/RadA recombinase